MEIVRRARGWVSRVERGIPNAAIQSSDDPRAEVYFDQHTEQESRFGCRITQMKIAPL